MQLRFILADKFLMSNKFWLRSLLQNEDQVKWLAMNQDSENMKTTQGDAIKIISLNIERDKHVSEVLRFIEAEKPEVVCLQEVLAGTFELLKKELGMYGIFDEQATFREGDQTYIQGVAILSRSPITDEKKIQYTEDVPNKEDYQFSLDHRPENDKDKGDVNKQYSRKLLVAKILKENKEFQIVTTHFTWGYYGYVDKERKEFVWNLDELTINQQVADAERLLAELNNLGELIFCVDSNAPRGYKVFDLFAEKLKDNIPQEYTTSIDGDIHRAGPLPLMVDGIFTTPKHNAKNVVLKKGISDHLAVVCEISNSIN